MRLFESDNVWKRHQRAINRSSQAGTPEQKRQAARRDLNSQLLWVIGALVLGVIALACVLTGTIAPDAVTIGFIVVMALYVPTSIPSLKKAWDTWREVK